VPAHFQLRKSETRRERLQLDHADGQLFAINGLGAPIRRLWLADASGNILLATNLAAGQKAALAPGAANLKVTDKLGPKLFLERVGWTAQNEESCGTFPAYLLPGTYLAELEANPFLDNGLGAKAKSARVKQRAVVYGLLEPGGAAN
jgi:hypothetical protein